MNYRKNNKKGFTLTEALCALLVLSFVLSLYMPAFLNEFKRLKQARCDTKKWQTFNSLVKSEANGGYYSDIIKQNSEFNVVEFNLTDNSCWLVFEEGDGLFVSVEEAQ